MLTNFILSLTNLLNQKVFYLFFIKFNLIHAAVFPRTMLH